MEKLENLNSLGPRGRQATYCLLGVPCNSFLFSNLIVAKYTLTYLLTILDYLKLSLTIFDYLRLSLTTILDYLRLSQTLLLNYSL